MRFNIKIVKTDISSGKTTINIRNNTRSIQGVIPGNLDNIKVVNSGGKRVITGIVDNTYTLECTIIVVK